MDAKVFMRASVAYRQLPEMLNEMRAMRKEIDELKRQLNK
jgi:UDP-3-O-[3-hydroxymyristoyl] glucosamine N-acyltransferase